MYFGVCFQYFALLIIVVAVVLSPWLIWPFVCKLQRRRPKEEERSAVAGEMGKAVASSMGVDPATCVLRQVTGPSTLLLPNNPESQNNPDKTNNEVSKPNRPRRNKKRLPEAGERKFDDLYKATGEILGQGSFGSVATYLHLKKKPRGCSEKNHQDGGKRPSESIEGNRHHPPH